ncbi:hypothetical protein D1007_41086 [Hordeum vulgare]|nr:hypothetical protein D1007_41086 [Hordeum vulgare]
MAAIRVDPKILEEHLVIEATIVASHANALTRLVALNYSSWRFLEAIIGAFDEDYKVFSRRARAYLNSRASRDLYDVTQMAPLAYLFGPTIEAPSTL